MRPLADSFNSVTPGDPEGSFDGLDDDAAAAAPAEEKVGLLRKAMAGSGEGKGQGGGAGAARRAKDKQAKAKPSFANSYDTCHDPTSQTHTYTPHISTQECEW